MASSSTLVGLLEQAQRRGWIGRAPLSEHLAHAERFVELLPRDLTRMADLGPGAGLPALVILEARSELRAVLIERSRGRADALLRALRALGWDDRAEVVCQDASVVAHDHAYRGTFGAVVARSFGPPAITAECAAPLLVQGGVILVSDPPSEGSPRWEARGLAKLGLTRDPDGAMGIRPRSGESDPLIAPLASTVAITTLRAIDRCPDRFPRRPAVMRREPLFHVKQSRTVEEAVDSNHLDGPLPAHQDRTPPESST